MEEESQNLSAVILQPPEKVLGGSGPGPFSVGSQRQGTRFLPTPIEEGAEAVHPGGVQGFGGAEGPAPFEGRTGRP